MFDCNYFLIRLASIMFEITDFSVKFRQAGHYFVESGKVLYTMITEDVNIQKVYLCVGESLMREFLI